MSDELTDLAMLLVCVCARVKLRSTQTRGKPLLIWNIQRFGSMFLLMVLVPTLALGDGQVWKEDKASRATTSVSASLPTFADI